MEESENTWAEHSPKLFIWAYEHLNPLHRKIWEEWRKRRRQGRREETGEKLGGKMIKRQLLVVTFYVILLWQHHG